MEPGIYNLIPIKKGTSVQAQNLATVTYQTDSIAIPLESAEIVLKDLNGCVYLTWSTSTGELTISGVDSNIVIKNFFSAETTSLWDIGTYTYELRVKTISGETWPILAGTMVVK